MNKDQIYGIEHRQALDNEQDFPIDLNTRLLEIDDKFEWIDNIQTHQTIDSFSTSAKNKALWAFIVMDAILLLRPDFKNDLTELSNWLDKHNNTLTIITDNINVCGELIIYPMHNIKVVTMPELFGLAYIDYQYKETYTYKKLYNAFFQRSQADRLRFFITLKQNNLLDEGYVSYLGITSLGDDSSPLVKRKEMLSQLLEEIDSTEDIEIPFKNFKEPKGNFTDLEEECMISVVFETYNNRHTDWIIHTEKTLRALQVPNITLIANTTGGIKTLTDLGFKIHPINNLIDTAPNAEGQCLLIKNSLDVISENDLLQDHMMAWNILCAKHNTAILKEYSEYIETPHFLNKVRDYILM